MSRWPVLFHRLKGRAARAAYWLVTAMRREKTPSLVFLDGARLYDDYSFFRSHFTWDGSRGAEGPVLYHCYWAGALSRHHELSLKSLLVTQSPPFEVWLWLPPEDIASNQSFLASFSGTKCLRVCEYVPEREAEGTRYEGRADLLSPPSKVAASNGLRTLVAWKIRRRLLRSRRPVSARPAAALWRRVLLPMVLSPLRQQRADSLPPAFAQRTRSPRSRRPDR